MQDISNYEKIREDASSFYQKIGAIRSSALNGDFVHFTSEGFNHLMYKGGRTERSRNDQITKFKLLPKAKKLVEIATTYQEYDEGLIEIRRKRFKRVVYESVPVKYWGLVAIIENFRIKIIIRQIGNGQKNFWSVIPAWSTSQYRDIKLINQAKGNLAED